MSFLLTIIFYPPFIQRTDICRLNKWAVFASSGFNSPFSPSSFFLHWQIKCSNSCLNIWHYNNDKYIKHCECPRYLRKIDSGKLCFSPEGRTADAVNERIAATVAHGQPVRDQEDEIDVLELVDGWMAHAGQEVDLDVRRISTVLTAWQLDSLPGMGASRGWRWWPRWRASPRPSSSCWGSVCPGWPDIVLLYRI